MFVGCERHFKLVEMLEWHSFKSLPSSLRSKTLLRGSQSRDLPPPGALEGVPRCPWATRAISYVLSCLDQWKWPQIEKGKHRFWPQLLLSRQIFLCSLDRLMFQSQYVTFGVFGYEVSLLLVPDNP